MSKSTLRILLLVIILVIGILMTRNVKENFQSLEPGKFPESVSFPILYKEYPLKIPAELSPLNQSAIYKDYPVFPVGSYDQITNNIRYWPWPNNATCSPTSFCGSMYEKKQKVDIPPPVKAPAWGTPDIRVNYYDSCK